MDTRSFHLRRQAASEGLLRGGAREGEFHEIAQSASQTLLAGVAPSREIHLKRECASEGLLTGVGSNGEFHENAKPAVISRLLCGELWGRALLEQPRITAFDVALMRCDSNVKCFMVFTPNYPGILNLFLPFLAMICIFASTNI